MNPNPTIGTAEATKRALAAFQERSCSPLFPRPVVVDDCIADCAVAAAVVVVVEFDSTACDEKCNGVGFLAVYDVVVVVGSVVRGRIRFPPRRTLFRFNACVPM